MEVHLTPELAAKLDRLAAETGRAKEELVQDVMAGYFEELAQVRRMLDTRVDDIDTDRIKPLDGEAFFEELRRREEDLLKRHSSR